YQLSSANRAKPFHSGSRFIISSQVQIGPSPSTLGRGLLSALKCKSGQALPHWAAVYYQLSSANRAKPFHIGSRFIISFPTQIAPIPSMLLHGFLSALKCKSGQSPPHWAAVYYQLSSANRAKPFHIASPFIISSQVQIGPSPSTLGRGLLSALKCKSGQALPH